MSGVRKNFFYSSILTTANYIFPLITYPYVSRVLGVTNIGICNFVDSIINYFILFSMMGISIIGIREIANNRNDKIKLNETFNSLFLINSLSTTLALIILIICIYCIPKLYIYRNLMWIGASKLFFNYLLIEWFYKGIEDFKYITIRTILVKLVYIISVFLLIRESSDYPIYYLLLCLMVVLNAILNITHAHKFVSFSINNITVKNFIKPYFILGIYLLLTSMYTSFNVTYLGFISGETEVGYYTTATKLYAIILSIFSAFTGVLLPHMSSLVHSGKIIEFKQLLIKSINILITFSIPVILFTLVFTAEIIEVISGKGYEGAIIPMKIIMPLIFIIGYEQILVIQTLMPMKEDKTILKNSLIGASIGIILNVVLIPYIGCIGSAIVWLISELSVLICSQYKVGQILKQEFPFTLILKNILIYTPLFIILYTIKTITKAPIGYELLLGIIITLIYFIIINIKITRNPEISRLISIMLRKIK